MADNDEDLEDIVADLEQELKETAEERDRLQEKLDEIDALGGRLAYVSGFMDNGERVVVRMGGQRWDYENKRGLDEDDLRRFVSVIPGDGEQGPIRHVFDHRADGVYGEVRKELPTEADMFRYLVEPASGNPQQITWNEELNPGDEIFFDPDLDEVYEVHRTGTDMEKLVMGRVPDVSYSDVGGLHEEKKRVRDKVEGWTRHAELLEEQNAERGGGVLLYGLPGNGKTLLAKAVAAENDYPFINVTPADIFDKWVGESEKAVQEVFDIGREYAEENGGAVIFIDELDALATTRGQNDSSGVGSKIVGQLLGEMDGIQENNENLIVMAATNRPDMVDAALLRPGRLDDPIEIGQPGKEDAKEIYDVHMQDVFIDDNMIDKYGDEEAAYNALKDQVMTEIFHSDETIPVTHPRTGKELEVERGEAVTGAMFEWMAEYTKKHVIPPKVEAVAEEYAAEIEGEYGDDVSSLDIRNMYGVGLHEDDIKPLVDQAMEEHAMIPWSAYQEAMSRGQGSDEPGSRQGAEVI